MTTQRGAFLVRFDEERRALLLQEIAGDGGGFSDALSRADWPIRQWEVCGLLFDSETISFWALAQKGRGVATGKVRVEFSHVTPADIALGGVERKIGKHFKQYIVRARSGAGGRIPPRTWLRLKDALRAIAPQSLERLERLEGLRDQGHSRIDRPGIGIISQQRDATGIAFNVFDVSGALRKQALPAWEPKDAPLKSFLDGLRGVRALEDQLIAHDTSIFSASGNIRHTVTGAVFGLGDRKLEVFNVNRTPIETCLGVDLVYYQEEFDAWTLLQYKVMERKPVVSRSESVAVYRPDASFHHELDRMQQFRTQCVDDWKLSDGILNYRLCGDGFYFKFCSRIQFEVLSDALLPGMYIPRRLVEAVLAGESSTGPRGGRLITFDGLRRHITNSLFAELVRDGWIGTRGISSANIAEIIRDSLAAGKSLVVSLGRETGKPADLDATRAELGF